LSRLTLGVAAALPLAAALLVRQPATLALGVMSVCLLYAGHTNHLRIGVYLSCAFTYYPLSLMLGLLIPHTYSYLVSATLLTLIAERLSLEHSLRGVLAADRGVDREAYTRAMQLSRKHAGVLGVLVAAVVVSALASYALSKLNPDALIVLASAVGLLALMRWLVGREASHAQTPEHLGA